MSDRYHSDIGGGSSCSAETLAPVRSRKRAPSTQLIDAPGIGHPLRLADHIEWRPRLGPELGAIGQFLRQGPARRDDHADAGIVLPGDVRELDAVHVPGEL